MELTDLRYIFTFMNIALPKRPYFVVFRTKWGYFGLAGCSSGLLRSILPCNNERIVQALLLKEVVNARLDKRFFIMLQQQIVAYFEGSSVDFSNEIVYINQFSQFTRDVLTACRSISFAKTISYGQLAGQIGNRLAVRAVGRALSQNPLPLIIPCHRVIRSDGRFGGFSAIGSSRMKAKLINHEIAIENQNTRTKNSEYKKSRDEIRATSG